MGYRAAMALTSVLTFDYTTWGKGDKCFPLGLFLVLAKPAEPTIIPGFFGNTTKGTAVMSDAPTVGIIMGSQSDWSVMRTVQDTLEELGVFCEARVISAHRTPDRLHEYCAAARDRGLRVIIAGAGMAAALPGAAAAMTPLPVLGVPMEGKLMGGLDALLAMAQMPGGVPVGTLGIGKAGAKNAALLAAAIVALGDSGVAEALDDFRARQTAGVPETPE